MMLASNGLGWQAGINMTLADKAELTERDREILDFEASWWTRPGPKSDAVRSHLGMSPSLYYRRLADLLDNEDAMAHSPLVVLRLRRRRDERRRERFEGVAEPQHPRR